MNIGGYYAVHTRHDKGEITIFTYAMSAESAKQAVCSAERCPPSSVLSVERRAPAGQLQPETSKQVYDLGFEIVDDPDADDCWMLSARNWVEDHSGFESKTAAAEFLIKEIVK